MNSAPLPGQTRRWLRPGVLFMVQSAFAFSIMSLLVKWVGERISFQEIVLARALVSLALSWILLKRLGISVWGNQRAKLVVRGSLGFLGLTCFYYALTQLPLADATLIQYMHPVFTAILAAVFLGERAGRGLGMALALSIAGIVLVMRPDWLFGGGAPALPLWPVAVALAGAFFSAAAYVLVRHLAPREHPLVIVFYFPLITVPAALPGVAANFVWPQGFEWLLLLGVGVFTQIGQVSLTHGLRSEPAGRATAMSYLQVLLAAGWGVLFFGEIPDTWMLAGAVLILGGTLCAVRAGRES